jgi:hypothetical protein
MRCLVNDAAEPPGVPRHIRAIDVSTTQAILAWDPPSNAVGALQATGFHVVCIEVEEVGITGRVVRKDDPQTPGSRGGDPAMADGASPLSKASSRGSNHSCKLPPDAREHRFRALKPGATYVLAVRACNVSGWGKRGAVKVNVPGTDSLPVFIAAAIAVAVAVAVALPPAPARARAR